ncbi:hypothetical protein GQ53DRAFT_317575 [Thozetella sp. PMI_491]|nr:hypothetical protein GQ53DRAFT_317575 [Thozetella sp. PMI_491]
MASSVSSIPRFLLPQSGAIWRRLRVPGTGRAGLVSVRFASTSGDSSKPIVLEKPERFNPPSHGSRLPKRTTPRHYGGDLSATEAQAQRTKEYPGLMSPKGSWSHWVWHSYWLHSMIAMGTLTGLAIFTFTESFRQNSPYADMAPSASDFLSHPIASFRQMMHVLRLTEIRKAEEVQEKRARQADDVTKRTMYRKAHGLPIEQGLSWTKSSAATKAPETVPAVADETAVSVEAAAGTRKKWLGIF